MIYALRLLFSETKPYENRRGPLQKHLPVYVTVINARKNLFAWEILASDIYFGRVGFTPEECARFQIPERYNLFEGGVVVDLAWHDLSLVWFTDMR